MFYEDNLTKNKITILSKILKINFVNRKIQKYYKFEKIKENHIYIIYIMNLKRI